MKTHQDIRQRIHHQRIRHIVDSYLLAGDQASPFDTYLSELMGEYASGLIELALVETLAKSWLTIPMQRGVPFLSSAHERLKQWQQEAASESTSNFLFSSLSPSQFSQITGLEPSIAFSALISLAALPTQSVIE